MVQGSKPLSMEDQALIDRVYAVHMQVDPDLEAEYSEDQKASMREDIAYNLQYLKLAIEFEDGTIFQAYAKWLHGLLGHVMKGTGSQAISRQLCHHYGILSQEIAGAWSGSRREQALLYLDQAEALTQALANQPQEAPAFAEGECGACQTAYLDLLLAKDTKGALDYMKACAEAWPLGTVYEKIVYPVMKEVGERWYRREISVAQEHYCTATTQVAMGQFYDKIFACEKDGGVIMACSVGSELHEMGARLICDLFESRGWTSIYLGAAVPARALVYEADQHQPDLIALSITMPQHLPEGRRMAQALRESGYMGAIAVGGRAFEMGVQIHRDWPIDTFQGNASALFEWASRKGRTGHE